MVAAHVTRGVIVGMIAALAVTGTASVPALVVLGALFGAADAVYMPAQQAFLPRTVEADRLPSANALLQGTLQMASIAGPPLAGIVIAIAGTGTAFAVDAVSFLVAAVVILLMGPAPARRTEESAVGRGGGRGGRAGAHGSVVRGRAPGRGPLRRGRPRDPHPDAAGPGPELRAQRARRRRDGVAGAGAVRCGPHGVGPHGGGLGRGRPRGHRPGRQRATRAPGAHGRGGGGGRRADDGRRRNPGLRCRASSRRSP